QIVDDHLDEYPRQDAANHQRNRPDDVLDPDVHEWKHDVEQNLHADRPARPHKAFLTRGNEVEHNPGAGGYFPPWMGCVKDEMIAHDREHDPEIEQGRDPEQAMHRIAHPWQALLEARRRRVEKGKRADHEEQRNACTTVDRPKPRPSWHREVWRWNVDQMIGNDVDGREAAQCIKEIQSSRL